MPRRKQIKIQSKNTSFYDLLASELSKNPTVLIFQKEYGLRIIDSLGNYAK